jgi:hypothetical protein
VGFLFVVVTAREKKRVVETISGIAFSLTRIILPFFSILKYAVWNIILMIGVNIPFVNYEFCLPIQ